MSTHKFKVTLDSGDGSGMFTVDGLADHMHSDDQWVELHDADHTPVAVYSARSVIAVERAQELKLELRFNSCSLEAVLVEAFKDLPKSI